MSRAFVKEDDQEEAPIIPERAPLPPGYNNYVTASGMKALLDEKASLDRDRESVAERESEQEKRVERAILNGKIKLLDERIASAQILEPGIMPADEVRFGATVKLEMTDKNIRQEFQLVGVDEADASKKKIAFTAPIAMAITGKKVGETALLKLGKEELRIKILEIRYI